MNRLLKCELGDFSTVNWLSNVNWEILKCELREHLKCEWTPQMWIDSSNVNRLLRCELIDADLKCELITTSNENWETPQRCSSTPKTIYFRANQRQPMGASICACMLETMFLCVYPCHKHGTDADFRMLPYWHTMPKAPNMTPMLSHYTKQQANKYIMDSDLYIPHQY